MQKDWTQVPMQPNPESRERRLREVQTTILGADYFKDIDPKWETNNKNTHHAMILQPPVFHQLSI